MNNIFKNDNTKHKLIWDYNGWRKESTLPETFMQFDWNNTLITMINKLVNNIHLSINMGSEYFIVVHPVIEDILINMSFYCISTQKLAKYNVVIDDAIDLEKIYVYSKILLDDVIVKTEMFDDNYGRVWVEPINDLNANEVDDFRSGGWGYIKVENYDSYKLK